MFTIVFLSMILRYVVNNVDVLTYTFIILLVLKIFCVSEYKECFNYRKEDFKVSSFINVLELIATSLLWIGCNDVPISDYTILTYFVLTIMIFSSYFLFFLNYEKKIISYFKKKLNI